MRNRGGKYARDESGAVSTSYSGVKTDAIQSLDGFDFSVTVKSVELTSTNEIDVFCDVNDRQL